MSIRRVIQGILVAAALPMLSLTVFYVSRWVLTGIWTHGGGDRALVGFWVSLLVMVVASMLELE